jgi:hypothetical protein
MFILNLVSLFLKATITKILGGARGSIGSAIVGGA